MQEPGAHASAWDLARTQQWLLKAMQEHWGEAVKDDKTWAIQRGPKLSSSAASDSGVSRRVREAAAQSDLCLHMYSAVAVCSQTG